MTKGEKKLYTPFVLRTGIMHSYRRTLALLFSVIILEAGYWTIGGFWSQFSVLGFQRWGIIVILIFIIPIGIRTIRDIFAGYEDLFNVFDENTEENLKAYRSMKRPSSEIRKGMSPLFKDEKSYSEFQESIRTIIFENITEIVVLMISISIVMGIVTNSVIFEKIIMDGAISAYPFSILEGTIDIITSMLITLSLSLICLYGVGYLRTISRLGASQSDLSVWNYVQHLQGTPVKESSIMSYRNFSDYTSTIGRHFSGIAFRIVLLMVLGGVTQVLYNTNIPPTVTWILASSPLVVSGLILVLPLNSLHKVMHQAKEAVLRELEEEYDFLTLRFVTYLSEQRHSERTTSGNQDDENLAMKISSLRGIISDTEQQWTWPVRSPMVLRIIITSMIPFAITALDLILTVLGLI